MKPDLHARYQASGTPLPGGIGIAEKFHDNYLKRDVILKYISDIDSLKRLEAEITSLQAAKSNHVVQLYDIIYCKPTGKSSPKTVYGVIEEFLPGEDLESFNISSNNTKEYINILYQVATGISDLHSCNIIHRDIKPNNIKFDAEGILKIFDFNLAKTGPTPTTTVSFAGTPGFMAPELYNSPPVIDFPIDVYAFGILAFLLAGGRMPPFCGTRTKLPRLPETSEEIQSLIGIAPQISVLLNKCVDIDSNARPEIFEIKNALRNELSRDTHRGKLITDTQEVEIHKDKRRGRINRREEDIIIEYDGLAFYIKNVTGNVKINNVSAQPGMRLNGSYVIILGHESLKGSRLFVTFDISNEEFIL